MSGVLIAKYKSRLERLLPPAVWLFVATLAVVIFATLPVANADPAHIVGGATRMIFSLICILFVAAYYSYNPYIKNGFGKFLTFLGEGCYSIYLLHPIVVLPLLFLTTKLGVSHYFAYGTAIFLTLLCSWLTYKYIEKPFINIGKKLTQS